MRAVVKEFIEATVTDLEAQNYYEMFTIWYNHFVEGNQSKDRDNLDELFKVFDSAGIDLFHDSEKARKDIIAEQMYEFIDDVLTNDPTAEEITLPVVILHLASKLYLSLVDLNRTFKLVSQHISRSHNVKLEPFKIVRIV